MTERSTHDIGTRVIIPPGRSFPGAAGAMVTSYGGTTTWLDVCIMGTHLPQMYRPDEFEVGTRERARELGLCPACIGYGSTEPVMQPGAQLNEVTTPCAKCEGTGRDVVRVYTKRARGGVEAALEILPHRPRAMDPEAGWGDDLCVRCLSRISDGDANHV